MTTRILAAGDHFVLNDLLTGAASQRGHRPQRVFTELTLPWPVEPFGRVAEVDEASGTEDDTDRGAAGRGDVRHADGPAHREGPGGCPDLQAVLRQPRRPGQREPGRGHPARGRRHVSAGAQRHRHRRAHPGDDAGRMRRIPQTHADLAAGTWRGDYYIYDNVGPELEGSTVGLVGYGAIGSRVARMLAGCGAQCWSPTRTSPRATGRRRAGGADELLPRSQFVTLHARVTPETTGMIGAAEIAAMPAGSVHRQLRARRPARLRRRLRRAGVRAAVRGRVRRLPRGADPGRLAAADHTEHRDDPAPGRRQQGDRKQGRTDRRRRRTQVPDGEPLAHCANPEALMPASTA